MLPTFNSSTCPLFRPQSQKKIIKKNTHTHTHMNNFFMELLLWRFDRRSCCGRLPLHVEPAYESAPSLRDFHALFLLYIPQVGR